MLPATTAHNWGIRIIIIICGFLGFLGGLESTAFRVGSEYFLHLRVWLFAFQNIVNAFISDFWYAFRCFVHSIRHNKDEPTKGLSSSLSESSCGIFKIQVNGLYQPMEGSNRPRSRIMSVVLVRHLLEWLVIVALLLLR